VVPADENGNEFDPVGHQAGMSSGNPVYWATEVPAFPRRGSSVLLKVKQNADLIAEFRIPNPARGRYPQWKAKELPVVSGPNEFQAALVEFKSQFEDKYSPEQFPSTLCAFKVMENGSPTKNWLPGSGEIFDATGNHWRIFFDRRLSRTEGDTQFRTFEGALWAGEDAWKLEITFEKVAGFSDDELIRFDNLPVLTGTNVFQSRVLRGGPDWNLELLAVVGPMGSHESGKSLNPNIRPVRGKITVAMRGKLLQCGRSFHAVSVMAEGNTNLPFSVEMTPSTSDSESYVPYTLTFDSPPPTVNNVSLTLAAPKIRKLDFLAKPRHE
jgi:hypothetical protein